MMNMLAGMRGRDLLRVKGLLNVEGVPVVVHLVQTIIHEPVTLDAWPTEDHRSRIVFIGRNIDRTDIERTLEALTFVKSPEIEDLQSIPRHMRTSCGLRAHSCARSFKKCQLRRTSWY